LNHRPANRSCFPENRRPSWCQAFISADATSARNADIGGPAINNELSVQDAVQGPPGMTKAAVVSSTRTFAARGLPPARPQLEQPLAQAPTQPGSFSESPSAHALRHELFRSNSRAAAKKFRSGDASFLIRNSMADKSSILGRFRRIASTPRTRLSRPIGWRIGDPPIEVRSRQPQQCSLSFRSEYQAIAFSLRRSHTRGTPVRWDTGLPSTAARKSLRKADQ